MIQSNRIPRLWCRLRKDHKDCQPKGSEFETCSGSQKFLSNFLCPLVNCLDCRCRGECLRNTREYRFVHLRSWKGEGKIWQPTGGWNRLYFVQVMEGTERGLGPACRNEPEYGAKQPQVTRKMQEAWNWLEKEGLLMHNPDQPGSDWFLITSAGEELMSRDLTPGRNSALIA